MRDIDQTLLEVLKPVKVGTAEVTHRVVSRLEAMQSIFSQACMNAPVAVYEGTYVVLHVNDKLMMSNTRMEHITNSEFARTAHGHVLVAGLGIGLVVHMLEEWRRHRMHMEQHADVVKTLTIIEKYQDVIDIVRPTLPKTKYPLEVICADLNMWTPSEGKKYDTIWLDIWPEFGGDAQLEEQKRLHRKFRVWLNRDNPDAWVSSWSYDEVRRMNRRLARSGR